MSTKEKLEDGNIKTTFVDGSTFIEHADGRISIDESAAHHPFSDVCNKCKHLVSPTRKTCKAFPDGIPIEIWLGKDNHSKPREGDHGYQFERGRSPFMKIKKHIFLKRGEAKEGDDGVIRWHG